MGGDCNPTIHLFDIFLLRLRSDDYDCISIGESSSYLWLWWSAIRSLLLVAGIIISFFSRLVLSRLNT